MFDKNIIELIIMKYKNAKVSLGQMYLPEQLMAVIDEMRLYEGLDEGISLGYIQDKIAGGLELSDEDTEDILATLSLHQNPTLIDEKGEIYLEE